MRETGETDRETDTLKESNVHAEETDGQAHGEKKTVRVRDTEEAERDGQTHRGRRQRGRLTENVCLSLWVSSSIRRTW